MSNILLVSCNLHKSINDVVNPISYFLLNRNAHIRRRDAKTRANRAQQIRPCARNAPRTTVRQGIQYERETRCIDGHLRVRYNPAGAEILHGHDSGARQLGVGLRRHYDTVGLRPNGCGRDFGTEAVSLQSGEEVAATALLPKGGLAELANADVGEFALEELDAGEVGRESDEGAGEAGGAGPEAESPLGVGTALRVRDDCWLGAAGERADLVNGVGDVLGGDLHITHCSTS